MMIFPRGTPVVLLTKKENLDGNAVTQRRASGSNTANLPERS
jgi:hypothetical protein